MGKLNSLQWSWTEVRMQHVLPYRLSAAPAAATRHNMIARRLRLLRTSHHVSECFVLDTCVLHIRPSDFTSELLDTLAALKVKATFFVVGGNAQQRPDIIRRMVADGHDVGSHTWSHANLTHLWVST